METKKLLLIVNPCAGQKKAIRELGHILEVFSDSGYVSTVMMTARPGHAVEIAREHAQEYELIACAGGDGTLNETISGVLSAGAKIPLAYLPAARPTTWVPRWGSAATSSGPRRTPWACTPESSTSACSTAAISSILPPSARLPGLPMPRPSP